MLDDGFYPADALQIDNAGNVLVETYTLCSSGEEYCYVSQYLLYTNGSYQSLPSNYSYVLFSDGELVATATDGTGNTYTYTDGTLVPATIPPSLLSTMTFNDPLATGGTDAVAVNSLGEVAGTYYTATSEYGFVYYDGVYTTISDPDGTGTQPGGINDLGQVVGEFTTDGPTAFFVATPSTAAPEPSTSAIAVMLLLCASASQWVRWYRRRLTASAPDVELDPASSDALKTSA